MKKILSIIFSVGLVFNLCAQEVATQPDASAQTADQTSNLVSKKGITILPEKGEYSLGIDASPFLDYLGNAIMNGANSPEFASYGFGITGKYMTSNKSALRVSLSTTLYNEKDYYSAVKSELTPDALSPQYVEDVISSSVENFRVSFGIEKRRGKSRVQGYYGVDGLIRYSNSQTKYTYGNDINIDFNMPDITASVWNGNQRLVKASTNNTFSVGAFGFVGVEFFFGPKLSLGGELGYSVEYATSGYSQSTYEYWNTTELRVSEIVYDQNYKGYGQLGLFTETSGSIKLNFYF